MTEKNIADQKLFSLNDLIELGLISRKEVDDFVRRKQAEQMVRELFPGMF